MFENIIKFFKNIGKNDKELKSKDAAKERLHLVLMQDRANVSADFLDLMRQEIIEVIKKYIDIDESALDVRLTNQAKDDGTQGAPVLYANIPILNIKDENKKAKEEEKNEDKKEAKDNNAKNKNEEPFEEKDEKNDDDKMEDNIDIAEEKVDELGNEEEITKQEEEKIEEAIKIVEEENNNNDDSETDKKEE